MSVFGVVKKVASYTPIGQAVNAGSHLAHGDVSGAIGSTAAGKVAGAVGLLPPKASAGGNVAGAVAETDDEKRARLQAAADAANARAYRDRLNQEGDATPRDAVQAAAPTAPGTATVAAPSTVSAGAPITTQTVGSSYDATQSDQSRAAEQAYIDRARAVQAGTAGPSVAELQMRQGSAAATAAAYSMAAGHKGYGGATAREAMRLGAAAQQKNLMDTGILRAGEVAQARQEEGAAVQGMRGQDISAQGTQAELALRAGTANQGTALAAATTNAGNALDAAKANQAARLQTSLSQAGFDQQSLMKLSDAQLQTTLANAGFKLSQEQIDDLRLHNQRQQQMEAQQQVLASGETNSAQATAIRDLRAKYAQAVLDNDQKKQAAYLAMMSSLGSKIATGGAA